MVNTIRFSEFDNVNLADSSNVLVGVSDGLNVKAPKVVIWTTLTRPTPPINALLGFNTDFNQYEFYDSNTAAWQQLDSSGDISSIYARLASHSVGDGSSLIGLQNHGITVVDKTVQNLADAAFIVQTNNGTMLNAQALGDLTSGVLKSASGTGVVSISAPLTSIDALTTVADQMLYTTDVNLYAVTALTAFARTLLADTSASAARATLVAAKSGDNTDITSLTGLTGLINFPTAIGIANGGFITTNVVLGNTYSINAYDTLNLISTAFATLTAGNPPTMNLSDAVTKAGGYIYRAGGTDVALLDGGTNASLAAINGGIVYSTASALGITSAGTSGQILVSGGAAAPVWSTSSFPVSAGTAGKIIISNGTNFVLSTSIFPNTVGAAGKIMISDGTSNGYSTPTYPNASVTAGKIIVSDGTNYIASTPTFPNASATTGKVIISDGTNFIASTSIFPNTVGSSGKILISDGTSNIYSTPTYPNLASTAGKIIISDGTNFIASTSIFPNTVGSAGKIIISDGTTNTYSTPTYPNASVTSGKIIISDGTNYISSTPTFPNAAGTAGKMVMSDGTNFVTSTPTYPNASATAGKVIISDGTNFVASTSIFPNTVGTAGKIIRSDGTSNLYTTATFADTYAVNTLLYASSLNVISGLATANSSVLVTSAGGVPSLSTTLPSGLAATNLTLTTPALGTPSSGNLSSCTNLNIGTIFTAGINGPTATNSTPQMCGFAVQNTVTGTHAQVTFCGQVFAVSTTTNTQIAIRFGTGTPPVIGTSVTGTQSGTISVVLAGNSANTTIAFSKTALITGLTPGTTYWFDMQIAQAGTGNTALQNVDVTVLSF